jgi:CDP-diacylglycerol---glycerol-3-phosphate 3-phosphatidyltransferase
VKYSLPNVFSIIRALLAPVIYFMLIAETKAIVEIGCILFLIGAFTDYLDGWWARKYGAVTNWGEFFDPLADKFLTIAAFLAFVVLDILPLWMVLIIIFRDILTILLRVFADIRKKPIKTSFTAKTKTFIQMVFIAFILVLIFIKNIQIPGIEPQEIESVIHSNGVYYSMFFLTVFTVWTVIEYIYQNFSLISQIWCESE